MEVELVGHVAMVALHAPAPPPAQCVVLARMCASRRCHELSTSQGTRARDHHDTV